ncbi:MAG: sigma-70 family RNA polymerase sigma factor [Armatimonadota bacterium]
MLRILEVEGHKKQESGGRYAPRYMDDMDYQNDGQLIQEVRDGRREAYGTLMDRYHSMVYGLCFRMTGNMPDADELAHDAFVEAYLKLDQLNDPDRFGGWLKTLALNLCRMWLRQNKRDQVELTDDQPAPIDDEDDPHIRTRMSYGLSRLSTVHRFVLVLHYYENLSYDDIARFLEVPVGTVMSRLHRARLMLKEVLKEMIEDEDIPSIPEDRFKDEVQAEINILMEMFHQEASAAERLTVILSRSPESLVQLIREAGDSSTLENLAILLPRLGNQSIDFVLASRFSTDEDMAKNAGILLNSYVSRCIPMFVKGWQPDMASKNVYPLMDRLMTYPTDDVSKVQLLFDLMMASSDGSTAVIFANAILCYPNEAFQMLMAEFLSSNIDDIFKSPRVLYALTRTGGRFCKELSKLIDSDDQRDQMLGLIGLESVARSIDHPWLSDAGPEQITNEVRIREKWTPLKREDIDAELLGSLIERVSGFIQSDQAEFRDIALRILGCLKPVKYLKQIRRCVLHESQSTRQATVLALSELNDTGSAYLLMHTACDDETSVRITAIKALSRMQIKESEPLMIRLLDDKEWQIKEAAITALGEIGGDESHKLLKQMMESGDSKVRKAIAKALYGGPKDVKKPVMSEVEQKLALKRRRGKKPVAFISLDAAIRYALPEIREYEERDLTDRIAMVCEDFCCTRRFMIEQGLMTREGGIYQLTELGKSVWRVEHFIMDNYLQS